MMEAAVEQAVTASKPILVNANPATQEEAIANLHAFSDESRLVGQSEQNSRMRPVSSIPRMRKCYGWLSLNSKVFRGLSLTLRAPTLTVSKITRSILPDKEHIAIIYEYIEEDENSPAVVDEALEFFWLAGFSHTLSPAARNWKSGVLVDLADIVHPGGYGWIKQLYGPRTARRILRP